MPEQASEAVGRGLADLGVQFHFGPLAKAVHHGDNGQLVTELSDGSQLESDVVLSAIGLRPRISLAKEAGLDTNRGILTEAIIDAYAKRSEISGNIVFGKATCPHCVRAKGYLDEAEIDYTYHDVVRDPRALYEMLARVKPIVGPKTPITVPQIWLDGRYVGGADQLSARLQRDVEPNPDRGQCSLSAKAA